MNPVIKNSCRKLLKSIQKEIGVVQKAIEQHIEKNASLKEKREILQTIPGIGKITANTLVALMPELGLLNRRQAASLAGLAPYPQQSGTKNGYRKVQGGRMEVRNALFMAAMAAARSSSELGAFYRKLVAKGKRKMVALTALMRKMIGIANAKIKEKCLYQCRVFEIKTT